MSNTASLHATLAPEDYLARAARLPPAPRVLPQLLSLLSDPDCEMNQVIELISFDPGLTAKVLRTCNSAALGLARPVTDIDEAVKRLGLKLIYQLVAAAVGARSLQPATAGFPQATPLWEHSVTTALAAQMLAKDLRLSEGPLFTAGLLHDIGKVVLLETWNDEYVKLLEATAATPQELVPGEEERFAVNHGQLGGRLLAHWKFPPVIAASVWHHPAPVAGMPYERETACLTLAESVADHIALAAAGTLLPLTPGQEAALGVFNFTPDNLKSYVGRTLENFEFVNAMCQMRF
jgi:putative nucleotidyltransferase with HDIG domain